MPNKSLFRDDFVPAVIRTKPKDRHTYDRERLDEQLKKKHEMEARGMKRSGPKVPINPREIPQHTRDRLLEAMILGATVQQAVKTAGIGYVRFYQFLARDEEFAREWAMAKRAASELMEGEILGIADDVSKDRMKGRINKEHIARSRLRIDVRKWLMKCREPKKYGDRTINDLDAPEGSKLSFTMKFGGGPSNDGDIIDGEAVDITERDE